MKASKLIIISTLIYKLSRGGTQRKKCLPMGQDCLFWLFTRDPHFELP